MEKQDLVFHTDYYDVWNGQISAVIDGREVAFRFYGFTKEEAAKRFLAEVTED